MGIVSIPFTPDRGVVMKHTRPLTLPAKAAVIMVALALAPVTLAQRQNQNNKADWPLHNLDLAGTRFSPLDQITPSNVKSLTPRWLFQTGVIDGVSNQTTPVVVDGTMYVT